MERTPSHPFDLPADAVHVWRVDGHVSPDDVQRLADTLSPAEHARAARFRFPEHRERFIVAHGAVRDILSRYLDLPATQLIFSTNPYGKPTLAAPDHAWLQFNLSHSGDLALVAVARDHPVGIDVEQMIPPEDFSRLVEQFFSVNENAAFRALPESKRAAAFFAGWTRKEAYVKALGTGVSLPLDHFDVTMNPDAPARLLADRHHPHHVATWSLHTFTPAPACLASLAIEIPNPTLTFLTANF
ncbi:MAG TPA: 4'-phosphopantetheinyl transferase superfamily protein [Anaerolineae bacterium]|nr:4'-phosphopantetheinyl transferase superfamily protein [Anaerolineae bacterium]HQH39216.1 4'-phosphopantetheinyl transferase superfamily protein [Anaerolineae bacterium]